MDNKEFIAELSVRIGRSAAETEALVDGLSALLKDHCSSLNSIAVPGFGKFVGEKQLEHIVQDEDTRKRTLYPPEIRLKFEASAILKARLAEKGEDGGK